MKSVQVNNNRTTTLSRKVFKKLIYNYKDFFRPSDKDKGPCPDLYVVELCPVRRTERSINTFDLLFVLMVLGIYGKLKNRTRYLDMYFLITKKSLASTYNL